MFVKPFDTIVVGVDFSAYSKIVAKQAILLARLWKARLVFVHALNEPFEYAPTLYVPFEKPLSPSFYKNKIKQFYNLDGLTAQVIVEYRTPAKLIRTVASQSSRPLIVIGYKGASAIQEFLFGSTAQNLALHTKPPVWVHRGQKAVIPRRVLIPHDLSKAANRSLDTLKKLGLIAPKSYEVFYVREKPFPVLDYQFYKKIEHAQVVEVHRRIKNLLKNYPRLSFHATTGGVTEKIVQKTSQFDLILLTHYHPKSFLSPSETEKLMKKSKVPIMCV